MLRLPCFHPGLRALVAAAAAAGLLPAAGAQAIGGAVTVDTWATSAGNRMQLSGSGHCTRVPSQAGAVVGVLEGCSGLANTATAATQGLAAFSAPTGFDPANPAAYQLASLGVRSALAVEVRSFNGTDLSPNDPGVQLQVYSHARFTDTLLLGPARPHSLVLDFHLSGQLRVDADLLQNSLQPVLVDAHFSLGVQSGQVSADGFFGSFEPYATGQVLGQRSLLNTVPVQPDGVTISGQILYTVPAPDRVRITLGSNFFSNPLNDALLLDLGLDAMAYATAVSFQNLAFGTVRSGVEVVADYGSTFRLDSLQALDASGQDITATAVLGFGSLQPVPEPQTWLLLAAGLAGLVLRRRGPGPR